MVEKIKQTNEAFLSNQYKAHKSIVDPKCQVQLKWGKSSFDNSKIQSFLVTFCDVLLPPLTGVPSAPVIFKDFNGSSFKPEDFTSKRVACDVYF